jgi:hypothetical protein
MTHPTIALKASIKSETKGRYDAFLSQLSVKGRATIEKHDERCEADAAQGYGDLWKRLAGSLGALASHATEVLGQQTVKFHVADGKYKLQVFALEDTQKGIVAIYFPDVLKLAIKRKILAAGEKPQQFKVLDGDGELQLEMINAESKELNACKGMVGWGRQACRADLNVIAEERQVRAVEMLCALAAEKWAVTTN